MSVTPASFRQAYSEFADPEVYSDFLIDLHLGAALTLLNSQRFGTSLDLAITLYIAHFLSIGRPDQMTAEIGGVPGKVRGIQTAKAVDKVSGSYDAASVSLDNQGQWALSRYGLRLYQMAMNAGAGGVQIQ